MSKMNRPLNIALVIKNFVATGGAERYAVEVAQRILEKGHRIDLYARTIDKTLTRGMTMFTVPDKFKFSSVLSQFSFAKETARLMAGKTYDVIHSHEKGCASHLSTLHAFSYKKGMENLSFLKKMNDFVLSPRAWLYLNMEKKQMASPMLAAVSASIQKDIKIYHNRENNVRIITPGVDINKFSPASIAKERSRARESESLHPDDIAVLFVGSEFKRKGLDRLFTAIGAGMKLFVVGRTEHMGHYRRLAARYDLSDRIIFSGLTDNIMKYYALSDIVVLPSFSDVFGISILEGMACGLPVITSQATGCSFLIKTGENGIVFKNSHELHGILDRLKNQDIRKQLGAQARETAQEHTWDTAAQSYEQLYYAIADAPVLKNKPV